MPPYRSAADAKYLGDLTEFVALMDEYSKDKWTLNKSEDGVWLKQSVMIKNEIETFNRQTHILRSSHYDLPVLWFNFYHRDGRPLRLDEISDLLTKNDLTKCSNFVRLVTQEIHPYYGVLFFFIDPRKAKKNIEDLEGNGNFIVRWLSLYGAIIGMTLPNEILLSVGIDPQAQNTL
ncbi:unnamed protein product, partial [Mesorhabditis belari]|uniref:Ubiquitin-like-conjugating enzyme ATG10 n=1 Tax=Mesorhabditis belari TaxID=2138241 RepID=A0AAF3F0A0_9BILA